jgi:hypothetical protein
MSNTPRTDVQKYQEYTGDSEYRDGDIVVSATFAELLETELTAANARIAELKQVLLQKGFVPCDSPMCNCGSWHHRYGLPERWDEIKGELYEAGVLNNSTGNTPLNAIKKLVEQRGELEKDAGRLNFLLSQGVAWRGCYNEFWLIGEWLYREQNGKEAIDTAMENTNG